MLIDLFFIMDKRNKFLDIIKLIDEVKKNECLYNVMSPQYKDVKYKERIWANIGKATGKTAVESRKKWNYIRYEYRQSQHRTLAYGFSKPYKYAEYMKFMDDITPCRESNPTLHSRLNAEQLMESSTVAEHPKTKHIDFHANATTVSLERTTLIPKSADAEEGTISLKDEEEREEMDWTERLIEEVKQHDCIYNTHSDNYKNVEYKKRLWNRIGNKFGIKGKQASRKWRYVRDAYRKYKRKAITEGFAKHKHAVSLKFLEDYMAIEPSISKTLSEAEVSTELSSDDEFQYELPRKEPEEYSQNSFEDILDSWDESLTENDLSVQDTNPNQAIENSNTKKRGTNSEIFSVSSNEEDPSVKKELMERIIEEVKKHDCIYNTKLDQYKNFPYKNRLWRKIGKRVGLTENEVRVKWRSLRDGYRKYKLKSKTTEGIVAVYKYADSLKFMDNFIDLTKTVKRDNKLPAPCEMSTDLSSESDFCSNPEPLTSPPAVQNVLEDTSATTITKSLFQLLVNKIQDANLTVQQRNDIEYAVSALVYSKLAEYSKK